MKRISIFAFCLFAGAALLPLRAGAQALTTVNLSSGGQRLYSSATFTAANLLTAGNTATTGDGAVLQLGYFSTATTANNFSGTFIPLSGQTSLNTAYSNTSIGDNAASGAGAGQFVLSLSFTTGSLTTGNSLPAAGTPLSVRFFNNTTLATSTFFNAVSNDIWLWQTPAAAPNSPIVAITLNDAGLEFLGGASSAFYTSQAVVPEPSSFAFAGLGTAGLLWMLKRRTAITAMV